MEYYSISRRSGFINFLKLYIFRKKELSNKYSYYLLLTYSVIFFGSDKYFPKRYPCTAQRVDLISLIPPLLLPVQRTPLLQELSIARNRLETIYMDAFADLVSLKRLNLSHNRLESLNEFVLDNLSVEVLDLSGNNFMYAEGKLLVRSASLKVRHN